MSRPKRWSAACRSSRSVGEQAIRGCERAGRAAILLGSGRPLSLEIKGRFRTDIRLQSCNDRCRSPEVAVHPESVRAGMSWFLIIVGATTVVIAGLAPYLGLGKNEQFFLFKLIGVERRYLFHLGAAICFAGIVLAQL